MRGINETKSHVGRRFDWDQPPLSNTWNLDSRVAVARQHRSTNLVRPHGESGDSPSNDSLGTSTLFDNHLLAVMTPEVQDRLFPHLTFVSLKLGTVLYEAGDTLQHVYFPTDSIVSLLYEIENGSSTEIAAVGNEGFIGVPLLMGGDSTSSRALVRSGGSAYRLLAHLLKTEIEQNCEVQQLLLRYTQALITQTAQVAVCNRHHTLDQQLCRWLLLSLDRLPSNHLTVTQELIANMLGVRRESVTVVAGKLQKQGVIEYRRGEITVLDRPALERLSCECYAVVRTETDRLLPFEPRRKLSCDSPASASASTAPLRAFM